MRIFILNFFIGDFYSSDDTEFIRRFPAEAITHGFSQMRPVRSLQIPPEVGKSPTDFTDIHRFFLGRFFVTQISQMTQIFSHGILSSDDTEFILRFPAAAITHGISQMRPVRSLQIPLRLENVPQISQIYTDFFLMGFLFIGWHGIYSEISCCGDYSRIFADATCPVVADTPWDWTKRFTRDSIENLCISVKSVGQNPPTKKNLRHLRNLRDKKQQEHI